MYILYSFIYLFDGWSTFSTASATSSLMRCKDFLAGGTESSMALPSSFLSQGSAVSIAWRYSGSSQIALPSRLFSSKETSSSFVQPARKSSCLRSLTRLDLREIVWQRELKESSMAWPQVEASQFRAPKSHLTSSKAKAVADKPSKDSMRL